MILRFKILAVILISIFTLSQAKAQGLGAIKGIVVDSSKKEMVNNASVIILETNKGNSSDVNGKFIISEVKPGKYTVVVMCIGYYNDTFKNVFVNNNTVDLGQINLSPKIQTISGGRTKTKRNVGGITAGILEIKKSEVVANNISSEQIKNSQDNDAAKAAARVPGVTLLENRFIMLRGLSQRYNSVLINGINAPSTEVDKRAFSFDLIPSSMLDKLMIFKSPSSDLSGDFAGGVIKIYTKNNIEKDFLTVGFGMGYRHQTSFKKAYNNSVGSGTDLLGFDNGTRQLPGNFPTTLAGTNAAQSIAYGRTLNNNFELNEMTAPIDFGMSLSNGFNFNIGKVKAFNTNSFGYSTSYLNSPTFRYRYQFDNAEYVKQMFNYRDDNFSVESKVNILSNWIFKLNKNNTIAFKNIYNQIGENETTIRQGVAATERPQDEFKNYAFHYTSRGIYFGQIEGLSILNEKKDKITYGIGYSNVKRNEPDYRRFRTSREIGSGNPYTLIDPPGAALFDAARFFSKLNENTISLTANYEKHFSNSFDTAKDMSLRMGIYNEIKNRTFDARWISYTYMGNTALKTEFLQQPINEIFSSKNINSTAGFRPNEGTNPSDKYTAFNQLNAAYVNFNVPLNYLNINVGARLEQFVQKLESFDQNGPVNVELANLNILPSANLVYYMNSKNLIRGAYGLTVNRPEFRELAPFVYYDFMYDVNVVGNPDLKSAQIHNFDLRYENYPSSSETFSFGLFYKKFNNPIENYVIPVGLSQQFGLKNAQSATNYGAEIEIRRSLEKVDLPVFFKNLSMNINLSYIISSVDLGNDSTLSQARKRPLQGQSPYIINAGIMYQDKKKGNIVNLAYNIFGERIAYVGNAIFPTVYEMPRHSLDLTFIKEINRRLSVKFGVSDLLNYKYQLWQDTDNNGKIDTKTDRTDHQLIQNRRGQMFNLSVSYKIK